MTNVERWMEIPNFCHFLCKTEYEFSFVLKM